MHLKRFPQYWFSLLSNIQNMVPHASAALVQYVVGVDFDNSDPEAVIIGKRAVKQVAASEGTDVNSRVGMNKGDR